MKKNYIQPITEYTRINPFALMGTAGVSDHSGPSKVPGVILPFD